MFALFLVAYGIMRIIVEFFREPDEHIGFVAMSLTMGQLLCLSMIACGLAALLFLRARAND